MLVIFITNGVRCPKSAITLHLHRICITLLCICITFHVRDQSAYAPFRLLSNTVCSSSSLSSMSPTNSASDNSSSITLLYVTYGLVGRAYLPFAAHPNVVATFSLFGYTTTASTTINIINPFLAELSLSLSSGVCCDDDDAASSSKIPPRKPPPPPPPPPPPDTFE